MNYYISKIIEGDFSVIEKSIIDKLQVEEFGVITEINMQQKLKDKLDIDFRKYKILGVCNPALAFKAIQIEDKIGTMLPCNIIIQDKGNGKIEIAAVDPVASMMAVDNPELNWIASAVKTKLTNVISSFH